MNTLILLKLAITGMAWTLATVIFFRALRVLRGMHYAERGCPGWRFVAFGLCYVVLAGSAFGSAIVISYGDFTLSHMGFLAASAGMIVFDRRRRQKMVSTC